MTLKVRDKNIGSGGSSQCAHSGAILDFSALKIDAIFAAISGTFEAVFLNRVFLKSRTPILTFKIGEKRWDSLCIYWLIWSIFERGPAGLAGKMAGG